MKILPYVMMAFLGVGCAAKKMAAKNADLLLESQIEKRIPLYANQKKELSKDVSKFLNEQKEFAKEAMPIISSIELDVNKVDQQYNQLNGLYRKLALNFSTLMSKYMGPLDEKQQKDFRQNLKDENDKLARIKNDDRLEKIFDRFESLFGSMNNKQKEIFNSRRGYLAERDALRLSRREKLHARFKEIFQMDLSPTGKSKYFLEALTDYQESYPENPKNKEIIKEIIPTLSGTQKEVFEDKTKDLKEILGYYLESDY